MPTVPGQEQAWIRILEQNNKRPFTVVSGTTSGTANTANTLAHGLTDATGKAGSVTPVVAIAFPTSNAGGLYQGAAPTASVIDIRSTALSVPYIALVIA